MPEPIRYQAEIRTIAEALTNGDLGILVGAGMSKESDLDLASELAPRMLRRALLGTSDEASPEVDALAAKYPFEAIAHLLQEALPYHDIGRWLREESGFTSKRPSLPHERLADLYRLSHRFPRILFTTNFDSLIEDGLPVGCAQSITSENLDQLPEARAKSQVAVVHLHGAVAYPKSLQIGEAAITSSEGPMWDLLRSSLATDVYVLLGYSLGDSNLKRAFFDVQRLANTRTGLSKRTFAVSPANGDPNNDLSEAGMAKRVWKLRGVDHIAMPASSFLTILLETTKNHVEGKVLMQVASAMGVAPDTLKSMLSSAAEPFRWITPFDLLVYLSYALTPVQRRQ